MSSFDLVRVWHKQIKKYYCQCEIKVQGREDASVFCGKLRLSSTPARCLFLCLLVHHMCPPSQSHSHSHPIPPSLHLFTKACLLQFCVRRGEGSLEVRLPRANAPALSDYFAADSTCSLWYKGSHEIRSNSKHPDPGWQNLSEPPQSWFWHPTVRCFRWQGTGCEGWEACVNFGNCEAEQTLSVHISCVHYQTALPRSVNDSVCLRLLLALSHTHTPPSLYSSHTLKTTF